MTETAEQKVAIITGASQGIGAGAVQAYRKLRYAVVANSRHITSSSDPGVLTVPGDIADPETGARLVDRAVERFGRVDTLVNNAGVFVAMLRNSGTRRGHVVNISTSLVDHANTAVPSALASLTKGPKRGYPVAGHRIRRLRRAREHSVARHHPHSDAR
jgi:NAD(P)-dependent dehydrogenase (short-subunit alcohol dehydrogenase family)